MKKLLDSVKTVEFLQKYKDKVNFAMILGTGWNHILQKLTQLESYDYQQIFGSASGVSGHSGKLVLAKINDQLVWIMAGRFHTYEGYSSFEVTKPIQVFAKLGVKNLVITSASGAINNKYRVGDIVVLSDLATVFCKSPLSGEQFQDLSQPFDLNLRNKAITSLKQQNIPHQEEGIYAYLHGPHFETFADKKILQKLDIDCVGMSTVPEVIMANYLKLNVLGLSCITNLAFVKHSHEDVKAAALTVKDSMVSILQSVVD